MASFSLWADATTPTYSSYDWADSDAAEAALGSHNGVLVSGSFGTSGTLTKFYEAINGNLDASQGTWSNYLAFSSSNKIDSIAIFWVPNGDSKDSQIAWAAWGESEVPNSKLADDYYGTLAVYKKAKSYANAIWQTLDLTGIDAYSVYFSRSIKKFTETDGTTKISDFGGGQTINVFGFKVWLHPSCNKPGTPTSLSAGDITYNSASLSWAVAENSNGYQISIIKKSDSSVKLDWTDCATNSYAATGLDAETEYTFKVKAKGADGYCELGDEAKADFTTIVAPELCPLNLTITGTKEYMEHDNISLTAALEQGTGAITYQWYKGSIAVENALEGKTSATLTIENCAQSDADNYYCVASKVECADAESAAYAVTVSEYVCPTSGTLFSFVIKSGLSNQTIAHQTDLILTSDYGTTVNGVATLRNNDGSGNDKAQIYNGEIFFNGANAYVTVDMYCALAAGDTIAITSTNNQNELWFTNTNSNSNKIETSGRKHVVAKDDLLDGYSTFYIWRKSGGTSVGTIKVTRPEGSATAIENQESKIENRKFIKDGQLFIEKNGHVYNVFGACIK